MKTIDQSIVKWFSKFNGTITAFSGGIDSTLVLYLSHAVLGEKAVGCISISPSLKRKDYAFAIDFCRRYQIKLEVIETKELEDKDYFLNPVNRCYICKSHLYKSLNVVRNQYPNYAILNGINVDDLGDYRPGIKAAQELNIKSPLEELGFDKKKIREIAHSLGLPNWDKPASPCLSSRIPYGDRIDLNKLIQIEKAENVLNEYGFTNVRVRHYESYASIEVPVDEIDKLQEYNDLINEKLRMIGFDEVKIDREGFKSGKLNQKIA